MDKKSKFCELPDYLIENYIIPYVGTEELFYKVRPVSTECYNNSKICRITFSKSSQNACYVWIQENVYEILFDDTIRRNEKSF